MGLAFKTAMKNFNNHSIARIFFPDEAQCYLCSLSLDIKPFNYPITEHFIPLILRLPSVKGLITVK